MVSLPEKYGDYAYFMKLKEYSHKAQVNIKGEESVSNTYEVYCRIQHEKMGRFGSHKKGEEETEIVFDLE